MSAINFQGLYRGYCWDTFLHSLPTGSKSGAALIRMAAHTGALQGLNTRMVLVAPYAADDRVLCQVRPHLSEDEILCKTRSSVADIVCV